MRFIYTGKESGNPEDGRGDALWIVLREDGEYDESEEIADEVIAHYDRNGEILSIEIYADASSKVDLTQINFGGITEASWAAKQHA